MTIFTHTWYCPPKNNNLQAVKDLATGLKAAFLACGFAQSDDTGQTDIDSMTYPGTSATPAGYFVFYLDDEFHATHPIYVKVEIGRGGASSNSDIGVWFTVGKSTNGAGTVSSEYMGRALQYSTTASAGQDADYPCYASSDGHGIAIVAWPGSTSNISWCFVLERARNDDGTARPDALSISFGRHAGGASGGNNIVKTIGYNGSVTSQHTESDRVNVGFPRRVNNSAFDLGITLSGDGVTAPILTIPHMAPGVTPWVSNLMVAVHPADAAGLSVIQTATVNGRTISYRAFPYWAAGATTQGVGIVPVHEGPSNNVRWAFPAIAWMED